MTRARQTAVVLASVMTMGGIAAACSPANAPGATGDETWTEKPVVTGAIDGGSDQDALPVDMPEMLCALNGPPASTPGETLIYGEDFSGTGIDLKKWTAPSGKRGPTDVLNTTSASNLSVHDGSLFVTAARAPSDPTYPYVTGYMETLGKYARTYGKVEFRARFPYAAGVWYAMWGRPMFDSFPEIDIELLNTVANARTQVYFVNHWAAPPIPADQRRKFVMFDDVDVTAFHTYTITWTPGLLDWAIDGVSKMQSNAQGVPTKPVYWIINAWVGGWAGTPPETTTMPVTFEVDYVHMYRLDGLIADPVIRIANPEPTYSRSGAIQVAVANFDEACAHVEMREGAKVIHTTSTAPYQFSLALLTPGAHKLTFVATDGVRSTTTELDVVIH